MVGFEDSPHPTCYVLNLWDGLDFDDPVPLGQVIDLTTLDDGEAGDLTKRIFVEWTPGTDDDGFAILSATDAADPDAPGNTLTFHRFSTMVVAFMGASQNPGDPDDEAEFDSLPIRLYEEGYDAFMFNEDDDDENTIFEVLNIGEGAAWKVMEHVTKNARYSNIALWAIAAAGVLYIIIQKR